MLYFCTCILKFFYVCIWTIVCNKGFIYIYIYISRGTGQLGYEHVIIISINVIVDMCGVEGKRRTK